MNGVRRFLGGTASRAQSFDQQQPTPDSASSTLPHDSSGSTNMVSRTITPPPQHQSFSKGGPGSPGSPGMTNAGAFTTRSNDPSSSRSRALQSRSNTGSSWGGESVNSTSEIREGSHSPPVMSSTASSPRKVATRKDLTLTPRPILPSLTKAINSSDSRYGSPTPSTGYPATGTPTKWKNVSTLLNTRDELLMGLLASQAMLDSQDAEILSAEEVDDLKREHTLLTSRVKALNKKLAVETKIRDAAQTLCKLNDSIGDKRTVEHSNEQLDAANRKVEAAQQELWKVSERANEIGRRLLEHRAAVLSLSVGRNERKEMKALRKANGGFAGGAANDSTDESEGGSAGLSNGEMSPASTTATSLSAGPSRDKFGGAHLFAGHADAVSPRTPSASKAVVKEAEDKLKAANDELSTVKREHDSLKTELMMLGLEKSEVETHMGLELQGAEETIASLEKQIEDLLQGNNRLEGRRKEADAVRGALQTLCLTHQFEVPPDAQDLAGVVERISQYISEDKAQSLRQREGAISQLEEAHSRLQAANSKVEETSSQLQKAGSELEEVRKELHEAKTKQPKTPSPPTVPLSLPPIPVFTAPPLPPHDDYDRLLKPIWAILPSVEARAQKLGPALRNPRSPKPPTPGHVKSAETSPSLSLSELDVRSLKSLYSGSASGGYASPGLTGEFSVEELVKRVHALVQDDRALVERLIRFAGAHDLLKANAERAQKLAHESSMGLETYHKQVRTLEDRNAALTNQQAELLDEIADLQVALERLEEQKRELEDRAGQQAETNKALSETNNALSAQALSLAAEAAGAPEALKLLETQIQNVENQKALAESQLRKVEGQNKAMEGQLQRMETQMAETSKQLREANSDLDMIRNAESSQRIALLDELNAMQQENGALRNQLRAARG